MTALKSSKQAAAHTLEPQYATMQSVCEERDALRAQVKALRETLEFWIADGHLQTFEDRERFRQSARAALESSKP